MHTFFLINFSNTDFVFYDNYYPNVLAPFFLFNLMHK